MKKISLAVMLLALLVRVLPAEAEIGAVDNVPAATLLVPYFEVDLDDPEGVTTLFSINNASAAPALAQVQLWSDSSVHVLDFMVYLTGYDVVTINLRDVIVDGILPLTASAGQDPDDTISPQGVASQDIDFPSCQGFFPLPPLPVSFIEHTQNALTGQYSAILQGCAGQDFGDRRARGYVTVNTVSVCNVLWPGLPGYFAAGGLGIATNQNILWGDYFLVDPANDFAQGDGLVHIEADALNPETSIPGEYTFYGRYVGWTADDNREPLTTTFATRYLNGGAFDGGTDLLVWRDSKVDQLPFTCGTVPSWYPLNQTQIVIFDEQENPFLEPGCNVSPCPPGQTILPFPAEANRTAVGGPSFPVPFNFGWLYINLNTTVTPAGAVPPENPAAAQGWVSAVMSALGRYSVGLSAIQLDNATNASP